MLYTQAPVHQTLPGSMQPQQTTQHMQRQSALTEASVTVLMANAPALMATLGMPAKDVSACEAAVRAKAMVVHACCA